MARQLGVSDHCMFLGFRPDVPDLLACFDVFVLPSLWEGLSISLLEALAAGSAIVTTNIKGNREVISSGEDGVLVAPEDPRALAEAVIGLLGDRSKRLEMGIRARAKAENCFSEDAMVRRTLEIYSGNWTAPMAQRRRIPKPS